MRENVTVKADRLLVSGRLAVQWVDTHEIRAACRGDSGELYAVSYTPDTGWTCNCPALSRCSHIIALQRITIVPSPRRWGEAA